METAFSVTENEAFGKRSPEWIFLKTPFSFAKTLTSQHRSMTYQSMRSVLWGSREGSLLVCFLLSKFECRISLSIMEFRCQISNCECHSVFVWTGIFSKTLLVWTRILLKTDKKDAFSKVSGYVWTGPKFLASCEQRGRRRQGGGHPSNFAYDHFFKFCQLHYEISGGRGVMILAIYYV